MKKFTKIISVMLAVALLASVCTCLFAAPASAAYIFNDNVGTADATKTTNASGTTYVCDFKKSDGTLTAGSDYKTSSNNATLEVSEGGLSFTNSSASNATTIRYNVEAYVGDPDFSIGTTESNRIKLEAGHYYEVTVEWSSTTDNAVMYVGHGFAGKNLNNPSLFLYTAKGAANTALTETFVIDGDGTGVRENIDGANAEYATAGNYLCVGGQKSATILFKKITITVYEKEAFTVAENQLTVNFDNGLNDIYMPNGDNNNFGTVEIAADPNNTGRGNALKITTTRTAGGHVLFGLPVKPGLGTWSDTNALTGVDGFKVKNGNTYHISLDVYCEAADEGFGAAGYLCYLSNKTGIGATSGTGTNRVNLSGNKKNTSGASLTAVKNAAGKGYWLTFEYDITATTDISGLEYLLVGFAVPENTYTSADEGHADYSVIVYFDNIVVTDVTDTTSEFVSNAKRSIRAESDTDGYVSAGIRFRGEIATATAEAAEEVGFIVAPETLVNAYTGTDAWYTMANGAPALATAKTVDATGTIYGTSGDNNQYQLLISGLTKENETADLKNMYFTVMMYLKDADGNYTYYNVATSSYREVLNAYIAKDQSNDSKY